MRNVLSTGGGLNQFASSVVGNGGDESLMGQGAYGLGNFTPMMLNPAAYYDFTDSSKLTTDASSRVSFAKDISGNSGTNLINYNGTANATVANIPAFGTGDFTVNFWYQGLLTANSGIFGGAAGACSVYISTSGQIVVRKEGTGVVDFRSAFSAGVAGMGTLVRSSGTDTIYFNGAAVGATFADANNYTAAVTMIGRCADVAFCNGNIQNIWIYTRALSAGEVAAAYAAGPYGTAPATNQKLIPTVPLTLGATSITDTSGNSATITLPASGVWISGARDLAQVTGAAQPLLLPWSGTNYGYLPGVSGNYFSTPDAAVLRVTGDLDLVAKINTPATNAYGVIGARWGASGTWSYFWAIKSNGNLYLSTSPNGSLQVTAESTSPVSLNSDIWVRVYRDVDNGASGNSTYFFTSTDGTNWTPLGSTVTNVGTTSINAGTRILEMGTELGGTASFFTGRLYALKVYNGIAGTLVFNADFSGVPNNATSFTESSANGATVTVASTGSKPAQIVGKQSLLFDGSAYYLKTAAFTLNQPETVYLVGKRNTWVSATGIFDGNSLNTLLLQQTNGGADPQVRLFAGGATASNSDWTIKTNAVVAAVYNGASGSLRINRGTAATGNVGSGNAGGFTLGVNADTTAPAAFQANYAIIFAAAHDTATQDRVIQWLGKQAAITV